MSFDNKYQKEFKINKKIGKKLLLLNNKSLDLSKTIKTLNNNFNHKKSLHVNTNIHKNSNYIYDKNIFKNIKLYKVNKQNNNSKKRNTTNAMLKNNMTPSSLTEGNLNNNGKKYTSLFNTNLSKYNTKELNILKTNPKKIDKFYSFFYFSKSFKLLNKTKLSSKNKQKQSQEQNVRNNSLGRNTTQNNSNIFHTKFCTGNISIKNIKQYSGLKRNQKKIINSNSITINNNILSDSISKKAGDYVEKINSLKKEIELYKKEMHKKNEIIKKQEVKLRKLNNNFEKSMNNILNIKQEYNKLKQNYNEMKNNYMLLKEKFLENEKSMQNMKHKEIKLMQVLYLIKEKGIDINSILEEVNQVTFHENSFYLNNHIQNDEEDNNFNANLNNDDSQMSKMTVYFPDKVKMNNIMESKWASIIPKLNFGDVPEYTSESVTENQVQKNEKFNPNGNNTFMSKYKFQNSV